MATGPWVHKVGGGYTSIDFSLLKYSSYHDKHSNGVFLKREVTHLHFDAYLEWSSIDNLDFIIKVPVVFMTTSEEVQPTFNVAGDTLPATFLNSFGNVAIGIKHQFAEGKWNYAWQADLNVPTGTVQSTGLRSGYHAFGLQPSVHAGTSGSNWYFQSQAGLHLRHDKYSIEYFVRAEVGANWKERIWVAGVLDLNRSMFNGERNDGNSKQTGTYLNDREYLAYGVKAWFMATEGLGISYAYNNFAMAHNIPATPVHSVGIFYKWKPWEPQYKQVDGS